MLFQGVDHYIKSWFICERNSKIPKGQTEIVKSEVRQEHGQQNETKDQKKRTHNTTLHLT